MPEIDSRLLLDALLGFIVVLFVPFGIRRGVVKEAMVSGGLLLGVLVADAWAAEGGARLAVLVGSDPALTAFAVSLAALLAGTFAIGYGAGAAVGDLRSGVPARLAGGILAAVNGTVFLSFLLRAIDRWLQPGDTLGEGVVSGTLLRRSNDLLLAAGGLVLLLIVIGWIVRAVRGPRTFPAPEPAVAPLSRPVRVASGADADKFEPVAVSSAGYGHGSLVETAPLATEPTRGGNPWRRPPGATPPPNGHARQPATSGTGGNGSEWLDRGDDAAAGPGRRANWTDRSPAGDSERRFGTGPIANLDPVEQRRCPTCGAPASATDLYCQQCGKTL